MTALVMKNYIVRIYRQDAVDGLRIMGTVEAVGGDNEKWNFTTRDELWAVLQRSVEGDDVNGENFGEVIEDESSSR